MNVTERESESKPMNRTTLERPSEEELVITRTFDAPARIVYAAWTQPELLKRWWAPRSLGVTLFSAEADVRPGGTYRYVFGHDEAKAMAFSGTYREVVPEKRLVATQIFEPMPQAGEAIVTATFEETRGKTRLVLHQRHASKATLDAILASGMERGMRDTFEQLEALVATLR